MNDAELMAQFNRVLREHAAFTDWGHDQRRCRPACALCRACRFAHNYPLSHYYGDGIHDLPLNDHWRREAHVILTAMVAKRLAGDTRPEVIPDKYYPAVWQALG